MKNIITIIVIVLIGLGIYYFVNKDKAMDAPFYEAPQAQNETGTSTNGQNNGQSANGKINIDAVCQAALIRMTFPNGEAAAKFVADCKEGKHPEVIEQYKAEMNLGDGAQI